MADGTFDKDLDMLMKLALLKGILGEGKKVEVVPFSVEVVCTPSDISCRCRGNKEMLEDIEGANEWFEETSSLVRGIMSEQTTKFAKLMEKKYGFTASEEPLGTGMNFADILSKILSGGADDSE